MDPRAAPIDFALDLHVHAISQVKELVWPGRQRFATEGARFVHALLAQLLDARLAVLVAARELSQAVGQWTGRVNQNGEGDGQWGRSRCVVELG